MTLPSHDSNTPLTEAGGGPLLDEELGRALLAEYGAEAVYRLLARRTRDAELRGILESFASDERDQLEALERLMRERGVAPPRRGRRRRRWISRVLVWGTWLTGTRPLLRLCEEAEGTAARWYSHFQAYFGSRGDLPAARTCGELSMTKLRHVRVLGTFIAHGLGR